MRRLIACVIALCCVGCASIRESDGPVIGRYLGFVEVRGRAAPPDSVGVIRRNVRVLGGWLEATPDGDSMEAIGLGWRDNRQLIVPTDCRLVVIVRSASELESVRTLLRTEQIKEGELCVVPE